MSEENLRDEEEFIQTIWAGILGDENGQDIGMTVKASSTPEEFITTVRAYDQAEAEENIKTIPMELSEEFATTVPGFDHTDPEENVKTTPVNTPGSSRVVYRGTNSLHLRKSRMVEAEDPSLVDPLLGDGDFIVKKVLGKGGMGVVYIANQASLNRDVAVKMLLPTNNSAGEKLVAEALVTGELEHPNIIPVYELGQTEDDKLFYAMKIVNGKPWSQEMKNNSERQNIDILLRVADAVAFAHDKKVIHRDLKPENVMLGGYGEVLLMDWGLAVSKFERGRAEPLDVSNARAGTPAYMAPEMARGDVNAIGPASDIYLLGAILFEILAGHRPHGGRNVMACIMAAAENFFMPTTRDDDLMRVALKAMATDPADRYPNVKAFQEAVREVLAHSESIALSQHAESSLADAEASGSYDQYAQAIFAFREAIKLWDGNTAAQSGLDNARRRYAFSAFGKGDYDLAASNLEGLKDTEALQLAREVAKAKAEAEARKRRVRRLTVAAIALVATVVIILTGATIIISDRMRRESEARELATQQEQIARQALVETQEARAREQQAATEREIAQRDAFAALAREKEAQDDKLAALAREAEERRQREEAERAQREIADEMARLGQLEDASWWAFDAATAAIRQREGAEQLGLQPEMTMDANGTLFDFRFIPPGEFVMGSNPREPMRQPDEYLHRVVLTKPFFIGTTEVTRAQWQAVVGIEREEDLMPEFHPEIASVDETRESFRSGQLALWGWRVRPLREEEASLPATSVSPTEIDTLFIQKAAAFAPEGWTIALPTEAEWEYACRAGTATQFFNGDLDDPDEVQGWTQEKSGLRLHPVGGWQANPWGLYDTHGNAAEVVRDAHSISFYLSSPIIDPLNDVGGRYRVVRGGSLIHSLAGSRSASRTNVHRDNRYRQVGFRMALYYGND